MRQIVTWISIFTFSLFPGIFPATAYSQNQTVGLFLNDSTSENGYTLFNNTNNPITYLIDNCGHQINSWEHDNSPGLTQYLLPDGTLLRAGRIGGSFSAGGLGGKLEKKDWDNNLIWSWQYSDSQVHQHHDIAPLPNGNILILGWEKMTNTAAVANGRSPTLTHPGGVYMEHIVEIVPSGADGAEIVWDWHLKDHLVQDYDPSMANFGVVADHPELIDFNFAAYATLDWTHGNALDYDPASDQIILSSRNLNEIWVIDHSTTSEEAEGSTGGNAGQGGDILYRWGNPQAYDRGTEDDRKYFGQHDARWILTGLPGAGQIMVFNNGNERPGPDYSSVDVIEPPGDGNGGYTILPDEPFGPEAFIWSYEGTPQTSFLSSFLSGAKRMPNGNTLICEGEKGHFFEVTPAGETVWDYINPVALQGPIEQGEITNSNLVFRVTRYLPDFVGLSGQDLTPGPVIELNPLPSDCIVYDGILNDYDMDGFFEDVDCNDFDASINPDADEIPNNNVDENCDGINEQIDGDMDGFNSDEDCDDMDAAINPDADEIPNNQIDENCDGEILIIDFDEDGFNSDEDCNDDDPNINPYAQEIPNNDIDEDCDGVALVIDEDMDGFNSDDDCNDMDASINPDAEEIPNNDIDEDCDGNVVVIDEDMDGFNSDEDCNDMDASINPDADEIPNNGIDENCDGADEIIDLDMDGFNSEDDCNDMDASINPNAVEIPNNDVDENCDGVILVIDEDMDGFNSDIDCNDMDASINPNAIEIPNNDIDENCDSLILIIDQDMDGFNSDEDCNDLDASINPDADEIPNNGIDENCDGADEIVDIDMDGFNSNEDCNDMDATINPDAIEIANNDVDENCDGVILIIDEDMDGFNSDEDCDDTNADINPDAVEIPNNDVDENCDSLILVIDVDMDGFNSDEDCDDTDPDINPNAEEIPDNGIDEDCDGMDLVTTSIQQIPKTEILFYPNPAKTWIRIKSDNGNIGVVKMITVLGKTIFYREQVGGELELDVAGFSSGTYILHFPIHKIQKLLILQ